MLSRPRASVTSVVSGSGPKDAQSRRADRFPFASMSNALSRWPNVSDRTRVSPTIAAPFGKCSGSVTTVVDPSGSTRMSGAGTIAAPPIRSNPKLPT
jgi:hypothetical protein